MAKQPVGLGYYASCVVNLTIRYDEAIQVAESLDDLKRATDSGEISARTGGKLGRQFGPRVRVGVVSSEGFDSQGNLVTKSFVTDHVNESTGGRSLTPLTFGGDKLTVVLDRVPKKGTFVLPHPRQAGTFNMVLDYRDLPIDPRLVRALGVEIHLGTVSATDYAAGMQGKTDPTGRPRSLTKTRSGLIDPRTGAEAPADQTLLFYGSADDWEASHDSDGSWVTITGRDLRGIFLDGKPPVNVLEKIDLTRPIQRVVADLIATIPYDVSIAVDVMTVEDEWPGGTVPSPGDVQGFTRVSLGKTGGAPQSGSTGAGSGGSGGAGQRVSYWDLITNLCNLVGGIPYFEGATLWIRPGRNVFETAIDTSHAPFASPRFADDGQLALRRLVVGRDVEKLTFKRKFGGVVVPKIEVIGFDDTVRGTGRYPRGSWPPTATKAHKAKNSEDILRIPMPMIRDPKRLTEVAHDVYEEIGRGEVGGTATTNELASYGGDNADPDLLRLRPTDPIEFRVDQSRPSPLASKSFQEEVDAVYARIGDIDAARAIVTANRGAAVGVLDIFRVSKVTFDWGVGKSGNGVKTQIEFQNYIVARHAAFPDAPTKPKTAKRKRRAHVKTRGEDVRKLAKQRSAIGRSTGDSYDPTGAAPEHGLLAKNQKEDFHLNAAQLRERVREQRRAQIAHDMAADGASPQQIDSVIRGQRL